ncbi:uncharacterized protein LOC118752010 [Rhagoletis pomonella]|uniref:uncharacterized protein LOC118752010 n=1 Tax=Rhagoletis pomonella TaxID=28610 RepID=UPI00177EF511|nr:uncharacterized protein LOC118752010 [Rhagoletis pomonella]
MVEFMESHPSLAKGYIKCADAKQTSKNLWGRLTEELNGDGPPTRDASSWKKVWADYKSHLKAKVRKNKLHMSGTGGGPAKTSSLNSVELRAMELLQINEAVDGIAGSQKFGAGRSEATNSIECETAPTTPNYATDLQDRAELPPSTPPSYSQVSPNCSTVRSRTQSKSNLLKMQVYGQKKFHKDCTRILKDVNYNLKSIAKTNKKSVEQMEERIEIERQKLKFAKLKHEYKVKSDMERNKIRISKLRLKQQLLDVNTRRD